MVSIHGAGDPDAAAAAPPADRLLLLLVLVAVGGLAPGAFCSAGEKKASSSATEVSFGVRSGNRPSLPNNKQWRQKKRQTDSDFGTYLFL